MTRPPATMPPSHPQNRAGAKVPPREGVATESPSSGGAASVSTDETVACTPRVWPHLLLRFHAGLLLRSNSGQTSRSKNRPRWKRSAAYGRHRPAGRGASRSSSTEHRPGPGGTASQNLCSEPATTPATYGPASADSHYADGLVESTANRRALERWSGRCRASIRRTAEIEARRYDG